MKMRSFWPGLSACFAGAVLISSPSAFAQLQRCEQIIKRDKKRCEEAKSTSDTETGKVADKLGQMNSKDPGGDNSIGNTLATISSARVENLKEARDSCAENYREINEACLDSLKKEPDSKRKGEVAKLLLDAKEHFAAVDRDLSRRIAGARDEINSRASDISASASKMSNYYERSPNGLPFCDTLPAGTNGLINGIPAPVRGIGCSPR